MKLSFLSGIILSSIVTALPSTTQRDELSINVTVLACDALTLAYPSQVFFPADANYTAENERQFSRGILETPDNPLTSMSL